MSALPETDLPEIDRLVVVGAGSVGSALAANAAAHGIAVTLWVRDPARVTAPDGVEVVALADLAPAVVTAVLAVPFDAVADVVPALPLAPGSVLVDATNPFGRPLPEGAASGAAHVLAHAPAGVAVVKAFNVLGAEHMGAPRLPDGAAPLLPVAGDDAGARGLVASLATRLEFDAVEVGGLAAAGTLEEAARYWGLLAFAGGRGRGVVLTARQRELA